MFSKMLLMELPTVTHNELLCTYRFLRFRHVLSPHSSVLVPLRSDHDLYGCALIHSLSGGHYRCAEALDGRMIVAND
jgi:hypothetical protein